jgi:4-amino-4-deoxy-L-arabinose transferase-like glycosyltransferase
LIFDRQHARSLVTLTVVLAVLTLYRAWVVVHSQLPLYLDEAQYWVWSRTPDWGYYSKPPMVAWIIRLFSGAGDSELVVRLGTLLLHPLTGLLVYALGRQMFGERTSLWGALLFITLPLVAFNSLFMTTDAPLFFFWALAVVGLWRALQGNGWSDWLLAGSAAGLGLMSKYSMAVFAVSVAVVLCLPAYRRHWFNPRLYLAALLALLISSPTCGGTRSAILSVFAMWPRSRNSRAHCSTR